MSEAMSLRQKEESWEFDAEKARIRIERALNDIPPDPYNENEPDRFPASFDGTCNVKMTLVAGIYFGIKSDNTTLQLEKTTLFRDMLFIDPRTRPLRQVANAGIVHRLAEFLMREDQPELQFMAACVLEKFVPGSSENTNVAIDGGYESIFINLLKYPDENIRLQAVRGLGNVFDNLLPKSRDHLLKSGALVYLLAQVNKRAEPSQLIYVSHTLLKICREKPQLPFKQIRQVVSALQVLVRSKNLWVLTNACWALSYLTDGTNDIIQAVIKAGFCSRLVVLLEHSSPDVILPSLQTVGYITAGADIQKQAVIKCGILPCLLNLLTNNQEESVKRLACWTIANITAGNKELIQSVIEAELISPVVTLLQTAEFDIKKEAAWAISNATSRGTRDQIKYLVSQGCIEPLCDLLNCPDPRIVSVCRKGLENILKVGELEKSLGKTGDVNIYAQLISNAGGLENIENLLSHDDEETCEDS